MDQAREHEMVSIPSKQKNNEKVQSVFRLISKVRWPYSSILMSNCTWLYLITLCKIPWLHVFRFGGITMGYSILLINMGVSNHVTGDSELLWVTTHLYEMSLMIYICWLTKINFTVIALWHTSWKSESSNTVSNFELLSLR